MRILFLSCVLCSLAFTKAEAAPYGQALKKELLNQLQQLQKTNLETLTKIDEQLQSQLKKTRKVQIGNESDLTALADLPGSLREIKAQQQEFVLRRDFIDRLIFQVDTKWNGSDLRGFLEAKLLEMASTDLKDESGRANNAAFYTYLSMAVRELPERNENLVSFIEGYMNFSSITAPKSPHKYLHERSYVNGAKSYTARAVAPDQVGDLVDEQIQKVEQTARAQQLKLKLKSNGATQAKVEAGAQQLPPASVAPLQRPFQAPYRAPGLGLTPSLEDPPLETAGGQTL